MLALSRRTGESVMIGNDIEITILEAKGEQVKLGIKAPRSVAVYRKELFEQIQASNKESAESAEKVINSLNDEGFSRPLKLTIQGYEKDFIPNLHGGENNESISTC